MPGDAGEKTEAATPRRRQEAREKGQVARSHDLGSALLLLGGMLALRWLGPWTMQVLVAAVERYLVVDDAASAARLDLAPLVASVGLCVLSATGPIMVALLLVALLSHLAQIGFLVTSEPLRPNLTRLNPIAGFGRLFSSRTLVQLAMNLTKLMVVTWVGYLAIESRLDKIMLAMDVGGWQQLVVISRVLYEVGLILAIVLLVIAVIDFAWQRWRHERDLRMSKEEVKEELRRMEGDPIVKQRRRRMQLVAALQHIRKNVPTADVVVTNPTELAVAIKYDVATMQAPKVVAKGQDYLAAKIREIAVQSGVPIVERKPLAQALFKTVEVGQEVPEQFYKAIAEILAYVYELAGKAGRFRRAPAA